MVFTTDFKCLAKTCLEFINKKNMHTIFKELKDKTEKI